MQNDFCDWVTLSGPASWSPGRRPPDRIIEEYLELDEGRESVWMRPAKQMIECRNTDGSSSTKLMYRFIPHDLADKDAKGQGRFWLDGNLGRIGRSDNLFGHDVLRSAGLGMRLLDRHGLIFETSPTVSRLDLTRNLVFESATDMNQFIQWVSGFRVGRAEPRPYVTGCSWVTDNWSFKFYDKNADLRRHKKTAMADRLESESGFYLRAECTLRRTKLMQLGVNVLEDCEKLNISEVLDEYLSPFAGGARPAVADFLLDVKPRIASYLLAWRDGYDFAAAVRDKRMSKSAFYRIRTEIKQLGYDIAYPAVDLRFPVSVREITPRIANVPDWYEAQSSRLGMVKVGAHS